MGVICYILAYFKCVPEITEVLDSIHFSCCVAETSVTRGMEHGIVASIYNIIFLSLINEYNGFSENLKNLR